MRAAHVRSHRCASVECGPCGSCIRDPRMASMSSRALLRSRSAPVEPIVRDGTPMAHGAPPPAKRARLQPLAPPTKAAAAPRLDDAPLVPPPPKGDLGDFAVHLNGSDQGASDNILEHLRDLNIDGLADTLPAVFGPEFEKELAEGKPVFEQLGCKANAFAKAVQDGSFDMKSVVGKYWQEAKKHDGDLALRYASLGKGYEPQRRFRQQWAAEQLQVLMREKSFSETSTESSGTEGTYEPFDIIVDREGGQSRPNSVRAAVFYTLACMQMHKKGLLAGLNTPWVKYNAMTRRLEFMYLKRGMSNKFETSWQTVQRQLQADNTSSPASSGVKDALGLRDGVAAAAALPAPEKADGNEDGEGSAKGKAKAKSKPKAKAKAKAVAGGGEDDEKKRIATGFRKLQELKGKYSNSMAGASQINGWIDKDEKWEWARGKLQCDLQQAVSAVEKLMTDPFFSAWAAQTQVDFSKFARKTWDGSFLEEKFGQLGELDQAVMAVGKQVTMIQRMHGVRA